MTITEAVTESYDNAVQHGFHEQEYSFPHWMALVMSECGEAIEKHRSDGFLLPTANIRAVLEEALKDKVIYEKAFKDAVESEIADVLIRLFDLCGLYNIDIEAFLEAKMKYNRGRPRLYGRKY